MASVSLEDPAIRERATYIHRSEYRRMVEAGILSEKTELIDGTVVDKMTKSADHNYFASALYELIRPLIPPGDLILKESTLTCNDSDVEPDIMVVVGPLTRYRNENPRTAKLVIEVAKSSLRFDRSKARVYAMANVETYCIVDLENRVVELFGEPVSNEYTVKKTYHFEEGLPAFGKEIDLASL